VDFELYDLFLKCFWCIMGNGDVDRLCFWVSSAELLGFGKWFVKFFDFLLRFGGCLRLCYFIPFDSIELLC
jgi:hypothetical protein